ncbi:MAG TPA: tetratricopeptide repeat protein [Gallionella sp.]|nr:tetratricopeptide repeat protein [Gallionella sp.]
MSVINQVLNQLEQRGANLAGEQTLVRPVPVARNTGWLKIALPILGVALAAAALAWFWPKRVQPQAVSAPEAVSTPVAVSQPLSTPQPVVASAVRAASPVAGSASPVPQRKAPTTQAPPATHRAENGDSASNPVLPPKVQAAPSREIPSREVRTPTAPRAAEMPLKQISKSQQADAEFRRAAAQMQQGRVQDALAGYEAALQLDAGHDAARQALVALLLDGKRTQDAERVLQEGVSLKPEHTGFAMLLARVQVERGAQDEALATLEKSLPYAEQHADYQAFYAALLQRKNRHNEAVNHYRGALQLAPNKGVWLMGYGISLQALHRNAEAKEAFRRALDTKTLSGELQAIVQQKYNAL